ncbi:DUF1272 domain-containing protein [Alkalicoccobacillus murimartini]|uniref:DUF1272 domain-containing protein n=1 Tax=Alkalicoccobacillus murimartini TaxID=171685 RepID=UPI0027D78DA2|nr:DUF1272 domain-containing protein [Alkalicoccobacillus murimartini]
MALILKTSCEKCNQKLNQHDLAFICIHECTFCQQCANQMNRNCPNCGGELVPRPKKPIGYCSMNSL